MGTPVHAAEFVDIKITAPGATFERRRAVTHQPLPITGKIHPAFRQGFDDALKGSYLLGLEFELALFVMHEENPWREAKLAGEGHHFLGLFRWRRPDYSAHSDTKPRVIAEGEQAFLEIVEYLLGCFVAPHAVNRDLHFLEPRDIQLLDQFRPQEKSVRDHAGSEEAKVPAFPDEARKIRMQRWLAAGERDSEGAKFLQFFESFLENLERHRIARLIELGTVAAGQVAAPDHNHLGEKGAVAETGKDA